MSRALAVVTTLALLVAGALSLRQAPPAPNSSARQAANEHIAAAVTAFDAAVNATPGELQARRDELAHAIAAIRETSRACSPARRAWFEHHVARCLARLGFEAWAEADLRRFLDTETPPPGSPADLPLVDALGLLAELQMTSGALQRAELTLNRADAHLQAAQGNAPRAATDARAADLHGWRGRLLLNLGLGAGAERHFAALRTFAASSGDSDTQHRAAFYSAEHALACVRPDEALEFLQACKADAAVTLVRGLAHWLRARQGVQSRELAERELLRAVELAETDGQAVRALNALIACAIDADEFDLADERLRQLRERTSRSGAADADLGHTVLVEGMASHIARARGAELPELEAQLARHRAAFDRLLQAWHDAPTQADGTSFLVFGERRDLLAELLLMIDAAQGKNTAAAEAALAVVLRTQLASSLAQQLGVDRSEPTLAAVRQDLLGENDGALVFVRGHFESVLLGFDRRTAWLLHLPTAATLLDDVNELLRLLGSDPTEATPDQLGQIQAVATHVASAVLPPEVREHLRGWSNVLIADHGLLLGLPWEVLPLDGDALLGERVAVTTLSSLPVGLRLRERHRVVERGELQLDRFATLRAAVRWAPHEADRLPLTAADLAPIEQAYATSHGLLDLELTPARLRATARHGHVAQFVCHGADLPDEVPTTALALVPDADDGLLRADDVRQQAWQGLVILSACRVGRGLRRVGEETFQTTLATAFLRAGAHTVIHSRGDLRLREHLEFLADLHRALAAGRTSAAALREARAALAQRGAPLGQRLAHALVGAVGLGHLPIAIVK